MTMLRYLAAILVGLAVSVHPAAAVPSDRKDDGPAARTPAKEAAEPPTTAEVVGDDDKAREASRQAARRRARRIAKINRRLYKLFRAGRYEKCTPLLHEILEIDPNNDTAWYNLACVHSKAGRQAKAVESLVTAVEEGYSGFRHMERDPDLDAIRDTPGYRDLIARRDEIQRRRAERVRDRLREEFGAGYLYEIDHERKLVFATNVDRQTLEEMKTRLTAYASAQWAGLFEHGFDRYLAIVIPRGRDWRWGRAVGGFYSRAAHMLVARTVGMTLVHEFTHALHYADQDGLGQQHPIWVSEGLATLFETSAVIDGRAVPQPNRRLNLLQHLLRKRREIPLDELLAYSHRKFMRNSMTAYAQSRYLMMYLHRRGLLKRWYDAYTAGYEEDPNGGKALEAVLDQPLDEAQRDWRNWVLAQRPPVLRLPAEHAYIGIQLRQHVDGVRIARVVPGSGAAEAGLGVGDVILRIDGERIVEPGHLLRVVSECEVGDQIRLHIRRGTAYRDVDVTLGAMPRKLSRPRRPRKKPPQTRPAKEPAKKGKLKKAG